VRAAVNAASTSIPRSVGDRRLVQVVFLGALASEGLGPLVEAREDTMPAETFLFVVEDEAGAVVGPAQWGFLFGFWRVLGASFFPVAL
jgi:hypothetical protein